MRTTLTIEDRIAKALKALAHRSGKPFTQVLNETLQAGLAAREAPPQARPYRLAPASLGGVLPGIDLTKAVRIAASLEDEDISRKLELRK